MPKYVICPEPFAPLFDKAEELMEPMFTYLKREPKKGGFLLDNERYVLYRAASMSVALRQELESVVGRGVDVTIYKFGKACGKSDAQFYFKKFGYLKDPPMRLALGPVHFALGGYAVVDIFPESAPVPNQDYLLIYDHPNSYEASAHIEAGIKRTEVTCYLNAGYSAGWCSKAFGLELDAKELKCRAKGDDQCLFVMAPPERLSQRIKETKERFGIG